jgi:hypothetical protein
MLTPRKGGEHSEEWLSTACTAIECAAEYSLAEQTASGDLYSVVGIGYGDSVFDSFVSRLITRT